MRNPIKAVASWILRKEIAYYQSVGQSQQDTMLLLHQANHALHSVNQMLRIEIDKLVSEMKGQVH